MAPEPILTREQKQLFIRDGFCIARGLIPDDVVVSTRRALLEDSGLSLTDEATWKSKEQTADWAWGAGHFTTACRSREVEQVVTELAGPHLHQISYHTGKNYVGLEAYEEGYIPVLTYPHPDRAAMEKQFIEPQGWHLDGIAGTDVLPTMLMMVIFVYLTDVSTHGGATTVKPGSHRRLFAHWVKNGMTPFTDLNAEYSPPMPLPGKAGDVIFFHYLLVHSGSDNLDDHIRLGLNTCVHQDPQHPYQLKSGAPEESWTPLDWTLRTDDLD